MRGLARPLLNDSGICRWHSEMTMQMSDVTQRAARKPDRKQPTRTPSAGADQENDEIQRRPFKERDIRIADLDRSMQVRVALTVSAIDEYAERIAAGDDLPPPVVFDVGGRPIVADGHHTVGAREKRGESMVRCKVYAGTASDALRYAARANQKHGVRLTPADKRRIVELLLADEKILDEGWSSRRIAEHCGVSHTFAEAVRKELAGREKPDEATDRPEVRRGLDGKERRLPSRPSAPTGNVASCGAPTETGVGFPPKPDAERCNDEQKPGAPDLYEVALDAMLNHRDLRAACGALGIMELPETGRVKLRAGLPERSLRQIEQKHQEILTELDEQRDAIVAAVGYIEEHNRIAATEAYKKLARRVRQLRHANPRRGFLDLVRRAAHELEMVGRTKGEAR